MNCTGRSVPAHACDLIADEPASYHDHPGAGATGAARRRGRGRDATGENQATATRIAAELASTL